jgi:hypothetical protein
MIFNGLNQYKLLPLHSGAGGSGRGAVGAAAPVAPHDTYFMTCLNNIYFIYLKIVVIILEN